MPAKRLLPILVVALFCLQACDNSNPAPSTPTQPAMIVRDDLALLRTRINLPQTVTSAKWTVLPAGTAGSNVPGPTDTILYAYLTSTGAQPAGFGAQPKPGAPQESVSVPSEVAQAIIPQDQLGAVLKKPGSYHLQGTAYDASYFDGQTYRGKAAILVGSGMLVVLQSQ